MFSRKQFFLNLSLVVMALVIGAGAIMSAQAGEIDTTSCDGVFETYYLDADGDDFGNPDHAIMACALPATGYADNGDDCNDNDAAINPNASEVCDGVDNNCNGDIDEGVKTIYYYDFDNDGFGVSATTTTACTLPVGFANNQNDCDDTDATRFPGALEVCNGVDNDCDGTIDDNCVSLTTYYLDYDQDGFGNPDYSIATLTQPVGYVLDNTDCDDSRNTRHPGLVEICDNIDNDCDGLVDEGFVCEIFYTYFRDYDGDGYGDKTVSMRATTTPSGYVSDQTDCDDGNAAQNPGQTEVCDGIDNDCDGLIDEGLVCGNFQTYYRDADGDGYGNPAVSITATNQPTGYVANNTDCDDNDAARHPGANEVCDGVDNDCDTHVDEGLTCNDDEDTDDNGDDQAQYRNHGQYVSQQAHRLNELKKQGVITGKEKGQMMSGFAQDKTHSKNQKK